MMHFFTTKIIAQSTLVSGMVSSMVSGKKLTTFIGK